MKTKKAPSTADFHANPLNPRTITDERLGALRDAMREFGDLSGLIVNRETGNYIGGHQRLKILGNAPITIIKSYSKPTARGTVAEGVVSYNGENFIYREVLWPPEKERAAMLAANKHGGEWTPDITALLNDLREESSDLFALTGFDVSELETPNNNEAEILPADSAGAGGREGAGEDEPKEKRERNAAPLFMKKPMEWRKKWKTEAGQLWQIGDHRLLIGDVFDPETWTVLGDAPYKFGFADPPYELTFSIRPLLAQINGHLFSFLSDAQAACIGAKHLSGFFVNAYDSTQGWEGFQTTKAQKHHTLIAHWRTPDARNIKDTDEGAFKHSSAMGTVIHTDSNHDRSGYKSADTHFVKPISIMDTFIEYFTTQGTIIMDAFSGSGSTIIAAHKRGLICRSCEASADAAAVLLERVTTELSIEATQLT